MAILRVYIKSLVKPEENFNNALNECRKRLEQYFQRCLRHRNNKLFTAVEVKILTPNLNIIWVGDLDLLVYVVANYENKLISGISENAGGATFPFPGGIYSEAYASVAMNEGKFLGLIGNDSHKQGVALANIAFHELAHNKRYGMPEAERVALGIAKSTHAVGGVLGEQLQAGAYGTLDLDARNVEVMSALLQHPVAQSNRLAHQVAHEQYSRRF